MSGFNEQVLSLYARGMSVRDIRSHLAKLYGAEVSPDLISKVTDAVAEEITAWQNRPLDAIWPVIYIDAVWIKIRDGQVVNRPVYVAVGVDLDGAKHVLGLWIGRDSGEGSRQWLTVLGELKARGVTDVCILCCDARLRKVTRNRGHFPTEQAALKVLYLAVIELIEPKTCDRNHVAPHWKAALNAFSLYFEDRLTIQ